MKKRILFLLVCLNAIVISSIAQQHSIAGTWSHPDSLFKQTFIFKTDSTLTLYTTKNADPGLGSDPKMGKYRLSENEISFYWNDNQTETWQIKFIDAAIFELTFINKKTKQSYKSILFRKV